MTTATISSRSLATTPNVCSTDRVAVVTDEASARAQRINNAPRPGDTVESIRQRAGASSDVLERILHRPIPPLRYGINE